MEDVFIGKPRMPTAECFREMLEQTKLVTLSQISRFFS